MPFTFPTKDGEKTGEFQECVDANQDKDSPGGFCKFLEEKQKTAKLKQATIRLNSSVGKITLASLYANLDEPNTGEILGPLRDDSPSKKKRKKFELKGILKKPDIDDLRNKLVTKTKSKIANLPGKKKLLLASLESITDDKKYASYFLLTGDMVNGRGWGVTADSIPSQIQSFKGKPLVVTSNEFIEGSPYGAIYDHPSTEHLSLLGLAKAGSFDVDDENLIHRFQNKFRIGEIIDVFEKNGVWRCIIEIDEAFRSKPLPPFVSPSLMMDDETEQEGKITKWHGLHLAGLDQKPAYGSIALLRGECLGPLGTCSMQLKNGSMGITFDKSSKIKNAKGDEITFAGFSSIRECVKANKEEENDPFAYCFAHIEGPGIKNGPKPMKLAACTIASIIGPLKKSAKELKNAVLISPTIAETQKQNILGCKKDEKGKCITKKSSNKTY